MFCWLGSSVGVFPRACSFVKREKVRWCRPARGSCASPTKRSPQKNLSRTLVLTFLPVPNPELYVYVLSVPIFEQAQWNFLPTPATRHTPDCSGRFYPPHSSCWPKRFLIPTWREISFTYHVEPAVRSRSWEVRRSSVA
jgi:hypothetical protein